jgi:hypothetical protein
VWDFSGVQILPKYLNSCLLRVAMVRNIVRIRFDDPHPLLSVTQDFDYAFGENGLTAYKLGQKLESQSFIKFIGEEKYKVLVKFILHYVADLDIPIKRYLRERCSSILYANRCRGTFVEFRNGMINVSPVGRNATWV